MASISAKFFDVWKHLKLGGKLSFAFYMFEILLFRAFKLRLRRSFSLELFRLKFRVKTNSGDVAVIHEIFCQKIYDADADFLAGDNQVCMDIGANIGCVSLRWSQSNPSGQIYALEPHPETFKTLQKNLAINHVKNVVAINQAVGRVAGKISFQVTNNNMARAVDSEMDSMSNSRIMDIVATTLDDLVAQYALKRIHLLKIDVEGYEVECLSGATEALKITDRIILEYHSERLRQKCRTILNEAGYLIRERSGLFFALRQ
jgi:FkbM family methyltransferase